jgi:ribosomal protein S10
VSRRSDLQFVKALWTWLSKSSNQKTLAFVFGGMAVVVSGLWQVYWHFHASAERPVAIAHSAGMSDRNIQQMAEELGVTKSALKSFFKILREHPAELEDLDHTLRRFASDYKALQQENYQLRVRVRTITIRSSQQDIVR